MDNFKITKTILENINEQNDRINECVDIVNGYTTDEETRVNQELQRQQNELIRQEQYKNNENRFTEINTQLDNIENDFIDENKLNSDLQIVVTYDNYKKGNMDVYSMVKGKYLTFVKNIEFNKYLWDYSTIYFKGYFYIAYDNSEHIGILKTRDFVDFEDIIISKPIGFNLAYAPELFIDNNKIYLFISLGNGDGSIANSNFKTYYMVANDETFRNWSEIKPININIDKSLIDVFMVKNANIYHMYLADDTNTIYEFTSNSLENTFTKVGDIKFNHNVEAPSVVNIDGTFYMYVDVYNDNYTVYKTSSNLIDWSEEKVLEGANCTTRHFTPCIIKNVDDKKNVYNIISKNSKKNIDLITNNAKKNKNYLRRVNLSDFIEEGIIDNLKVDGNTIYYLNTIDKGTSITINNIVRGNISTDESIYFLVAIDDISLRINRCSVLAINNDFIISKQSQNISTLIKFTDCYLSNNWSEKYLRLESTDNNTIINSVINSVVINNKNIWNEGNKNYIDAQNVGNAYFYIANYDSPTDVDTIINGKQGTELTLYISNHNTITFKNSNKLKLKNGVDFTVPHSTLIKFVCVDGTNWVELCRSINITQ